MWTKPEDHEAWRMCQSCDPNKPSGLYGIQEDYKSMSTYFKANRTPCNFIVYSPIELSNWPESYCEIALVGHSVSNHPMG